ncbi:hypothetical protein Ahy_A09g045667 [Arachis hypogaea]|uniref:Protein FAR1-RELATED SEQUENCE n=1 Tax=Arachis hypogaea TaxID=3818 RepID=A0A445BMV7_ARAHY|nr:hypothetical protein Ahy_A09g045667 [Arachis hypogaea]
MVGIAGGYSLLGFTKKDAYNYIDKTKQEKIVNGDANATIVYLQKKVTADPMYMERYNVTEDVLDESIPSYTWLLQNMLEVMCHKFPSVLVTDGNNAMIAMWLYGDIKVTDFEGE